MKGRLSPQGGESPRFAGERGWKKQQVALVNKTWTLKSKKLESEI